MKQTKPILLCVSHPELARATGYTITPNRLLQLANQCGEVRSRKVFLDPSMTRRQRALQNWSDAGFETVLAATRSHSVSAVNKFMGITTMRNAVDFEPYAVIVAASGRDNELNEFVRSLQERAVPVILFATDRMSPLARLADQAFFLADFSDGTPLPTLEQMQKLRLIRQTESFLDKLEKKDPPAYALVYDILGIGFSASADAEIRASLRRRIRTQQVPNLIIALLAILAFRPDEPAGALVPSRRIQETLRLYGVPNAAYHEMADILREETTLLPARSVNRSEARYARPANDPVHRLGRELWTEFRDQRPQIFMDRVIASIEILITAPDGLDETMRDVLSALVTSEGIRPVEERRRAYAAWGLTDPRAIEDFERRLLEILMDADGPAARPAISESGVHPVIQLARPQPEPAPSSPLSKTGT